MSGQLGASSSSGAPKDEDFEVVVPSPESSARSTATLFAERAYWTFVRGVQREGLDLATAWAKLNDAEEYWRRRSWDILVERYNVDKFWSSEQAQYWSYAWIKCWRETITRLQEEQLQKEREIQHEVERLIGPHRDEMQRSAELRDSLRRVQQLQTERDRRQREAQARRRAQETAFDAELQFRTDALMKK